MTEFLFALHPGATSQQVAIVSDGLGARFPDHKFTTTAAEGFSANAIIPITGTPHPTESDTVIVTMPPKGLVAKVREAFADLLADARAAKPS